MSDNKRYYWLKLNENFFEDDTITWLEEQENGKDYVIFYLKLCLKSLQDNGSLIRYVGEKLIPYDMNALAKLTDTKIDTVVVAMRLFGEIGLISKLDGGELYMNQINEMIGSETDVAKRVRKHRVKQAMLQSNGDVTKCNTEIEYRDKSLELERELEKDKDTVVAKATTEPIPYQDIVNLYNEICGDQLSKVQVISDARKIAIKTMWNFAKKDIELFRTIFSKVIDSDFASGRTGAWTSCNFDWLMKKNNAIKVIEGNYDNKGPSGPGGKQSLTEELQSQEVQDWLNS